MNTKLEAVREAIVKAVPEIYELHEYCGWHTDAMDWRKCKQCTETAKYRPITLEDMIRAVVKQVERVSLSITSGLDEVALCSGDERAWWTLGLPLDQQRQPVIDLLYDLLANTERV